MFISGLLLSLGGLQEPSIHRRQFWNPSQQPLRRRQVARRTAHRERNAPTLETSWRERGNTPAARVRQSNVSGTPEAFCGRRSRTLKSRAPRLFTSGSRLDIRSRRDCVLFQEDLDFLIKLLHVDDADMQISKLVNCLSVNGRKKPIGV